MDNILVVDDERNIRTLCSRPGYCPYWL